MDKITLSEIAAVVAAKNGISKAKAEEILKSAVETVKEEVKKGNKVDIYRFGIFKKTERSARTGKNPKTGEKLQIAACFVPSFKASQSWKNEVNFLA